MFTNTTQHKPNIKQLAPYETDTLHHAPVLRNRAQADLEKERSFAIKKFAKALLTVCDTFRCGGARLLL